MTIRKKLSEDAWTALTEALACYHWYKGPFENLVRGRFAEAPELLSQLSFGESKRAVASHMVTLLRADEPRYQDLVIDALLGLAEVDAEFAALSRETDDPQRLDDAKYARELVVKVTEQFREHVRNRERIQSEQDRMAAADRARKAHFDELRRLQDTYLQMAAPDTEPHQRGRDFERLLNELFNLYDLEPRAAYSLEHQQIDGAFTFRTDDYLLEAKWHKGALEPKHLRDFRFKIDGMARNTLGLCISVHGFTDGAVAEQSGNGTPMVLMDGSDLMAVLGGHIELPQLLEKKRRHAAETGVAFLPIGQIG